LRGSRTPAAARRVAIRRAAGSGGGSVRTHDPRQVTTIGGAQRMAIAPARAMVRSWHLIEGERG
jgi:hypothetical protein